MASKHLISDSAVVPAHIAKQVVSPAAYADWDAIHEAFTELRKTLPLGLVEAPGFDPFWLVTKHADLMEISRQPLIFSNNDHRCALLSQSAERQYLETRDEVPFIRALVTMDAPEHSVYRRLTFKNFTPKGIRGLEESIRALAVESIDEMAAQGSSCDFAESVALRYPLRVILSLMGLPREDEDMMLRLTQEVFNPQDPDMSKTRSDVDESEASSYDLGALAEFNQFFSDLIKARRANPTDDIASLIANARVDDKLLPDWDVASQYIAILTAGHDTTSSSTAGGVAALAAAPDQFTMMKNDRSLIPALVEECVRWTSPLLSFMRTAERDYTLRDQTIRKGDWLMLSYPSANRDEDVFEEPFVFKANRTPNPQIGFGYGPHICLGQHLGRLEMRIFFEEFFRRVNSVELTGHVERSRSINVSAIKRMPIKFTMS
ncbi:hypothetical protein BSL82_10825 [Tardibacter chloracetimidivorans]|uniref:Cytochrome n=1 Tax=Tardibacter chloracetimidivorans TaxID=1921510 RepID=A0A1L3ZVR2_9SPHN|nr:cytochrome P450 [Tardibacter chloracetimidivorans]API59746.1 hypothetical protein BSL82_10825 [Tardibacter chloracetimidivorans]